MANDAIVRLVNYGRMVLLVLLYQKIIIGKTIKYIDHFHPNLLMYKLLISTDDKCESCFVRDDQRERNSQLKNNYRGAKISHKYLMIKITNLFGFIKDLEKIIFGIGFKLILRETEATRQ